MSQQYHIVVRFGCTFQAALTGEAKGAREATRELGAQVQALGSDVSESESKMSSLLQSLRMLEKRQLEQQSAAAEAKSAREETGQLREKVYALSASFSGSEKNMNSLLEALRTLETRQREQCVKGAGTTEEQVSRQQMQASARRGWYNAEHCPFEQMLLGYASVACMPETLINDVDGFVSRSSSRTSPRSSLSLRAVSYIVQGLKLDGERTVCPDNKVIYHCFRLDACRSR